MFYIIGHQNIKNMQQSQILAILQFHLNAYQPAKISR